MFPPGPARSGVGGPVPGHGTGMEDSTHAELPATGPEEGEPDVRTSLDGDVATLTLDGELTGAARRPLVRAMTDLLLGTPTLRSVRLDLRAAAYMNSAGMAVLVQLQKLAMPRSIDFVLVAPTDVVIRPLQLSGLWTRFRIEEHDAG
jgi:stage II sporulation protein AA (anti-sigma F factor antagonist)